MNIHGTIFSDAAWAVWEPLIDEVRPRGKTPPHDLRRSMSAIFWRHQNQCQWRSMPPEFGPWWLGSHVFLRWSKLGVWERLLNLAEQNGMLDVGMVNGIGWQPSRQAGRARYNATAISEACVRVLAGLLAAEQGIGFGQRCDPEDDATLAMATSPLPGPNQISMGYA